MLCVLLGWAERPGSRARGLANRAEVSANRLEASAWVDGQVRGGDGWEWSGRISPVDFFHYYLTNLK
jgi:hypothetical protein